MLFCDLTSNNNELFQYLHTFGIPIWRSKLKRFCRFTLGLNRAPFPPKISPFLHRFKSIWLILVSNFILFVGHPYSNFKMAAICWLGSKSMDNFPNFCLSFVRQFHLNKFNQIRFFYRQIYLPPKHHSEIWNIGAWKWPHWSHLKNNYIFRIV